MQVEESSRISHPADSHQDPGPLPDVESHWQNSDPLESSEGVFFAFGIWWGKERFAPFVRHG